VYVAVQQPAGGRSPHRPNLIW